MEKTRTLNAIPCCPNCGADNYASAFQRDVQAFRGQPGGRHRTRFSQNMCYLCLFHWREWNLRPAMCKPPFKEHRS